MSATSNEWESAVATAGCGHAFYAQLQGGQRRERHRLSGLLDREFLVDPQLLRDARTNARAVRTALTVEMWDAINGTWLELQRYGNGPTSREEFARFLRWVQESSLRFDGSAYRTMLRNDAYWFSRLGVYVERADNTARILDVKYHLLLPDNRAGRRPARLLPVGGDPALGLGAHRLSLGLSRQRQAVADRRPPDPQGGDAALAGLLLRGDRAQSRQTRERLWQAGTRAAPGPRRAHPAAEQPHGRIFQRGLHEFINEFITENNKLGAAIAEQYLV